MQILYISETTKDIKLKLLTSLQGHYCRPLTMSHNSALEYDCIMALCEIRKKKHYQGVLLTALVIKQMSPFAFRSEGQGHNGLQLVSAQ